MKKLLLILALLSPGIASASLVDSTSNSGFSTSPICTVPTGVAANDIVIMTATVEVGAAFDPVDLPTDFTEIQENDVTADGQTMWLGWKRLTGADSGSYTFGSVTDGGSNREWICQAYAFTGRDTTNDPVSTANVSNTLNSDPVTVTATGVTALNGDDLLWISAPDVNSANVGDGHSAVPANFTELEDVENVWSNLAGANRDNVSAGATGNLSGTFELASNQAGWAAYLVRVPGDSLSIDQQAFRFRNDDGSESTATWLAAENAHITQPMMTNTRLRLQASTTGDLPSSAYQLEYKLSTDSTYKLVGTTSPSISFVASSTPVGDTDNSAAVSFPTGVRAGDLLVLAASHKATTTTATIPTGWTLATHAMGESGSAVADSGGARVTVLVKEADGSETGTQDLAVPNDNVTYAQMTVFRKGTGQIWSYEAVGASDNSGGTAWSAATTTALSVRPGDIVLQASGFNTDARNYSAQAITMTGVTFGTAVEVEDGAGTTLGQDTDLNISYHPVTAGSVSVAPTFTMTASGSTATAPAGGTVMLRIRQTDAPIQLKASANITDTGEDTTAQLSVPGGKSFTAGRINDTENPADPVDLALDHYSEFEWNLLATSTASNGDIYQFRLTQNGAAFDTYNVTPQWTIGGGGISFDAFTVGTNGTGNLSFVHVPNGTPRGALCHITQFGSEADQVSGVTYGGTAMTEVAGSPALQVGGEVDATYAYFLGSSVPTGAQTVTATVSGAATKSIECLTVAAEADTEVLDSEVINSTSAANPSVTLSASSRKNFSSINFLSGHDDPSSITPLANWASRNETDGGSISQGTYTYNILGTSDVTAGWTQTAEDALGIAVAIAEVQAAAAAVASGIHDIFFFD